MINIFDLIKYKFRRIKKGLFVITSFNGHYSDSPLYISNYLKDNYKDIKMVWIVKNAKERPTNQGVQFVEYTHKNLLFYRSIARVIIDNVDAGSYYTLNKGEFFKNAKKRLFLFFKRKKGQFIFTTWHGVPLKKMGCDQIGSKEKGCISNRVYMLTNCTYEKEIMNRLTFNKLKIENIGSPRNDILFSSCSLFKRELGLPENKKVILYAPTFRNEGNLLSSIAIERSGVSQLNSLNCFDLLNKLSEKFGGEFVMVCRFHYHVEKSISWEDLNSKYHGLIVNGNKCEDMAKYLACSDVLITDASSCMFDFMLTRRPCFLFFPDYDFYKNEERGLYVEIEKLPFPLSMNSDDLLKSIDSFCDSDYRKKVDSTIDSFGITDCGCSSKKIVDFIMSKLKNGKRY